VRDEGYTERELPAYGEPAQPAIAARAGTELRKVRTGTALAGLALVLSLVAVWVFPAFSGGTGAGRVWAVALAVCGAVLLAICAFQLLAWQRSLAAWTGRAPRPLAPLSAASWAVYLVSYPVLGVAVWAAVAGSAAAGWTAAATVLMILALVLLIAANLLAADQYVRASGPPGTLPAHMHTLTERDDRLRRR